jgi:hypothetical protein
VQRGVEEGRSVGEPIQDRGVEAGEVAHVAREEAGCAMRPRVERHGARALGEERGVRCGQELSCRREGGISWSVVGRGSGRRGGSVRSGEELSCRREGGISWSGRGNGGRHLGEPTFATTEGW